MSNIKPKYVRKETIEQDRLCFVDLPNTNRRLVLDAELCRDLTKHHWYVAGTYVFNRRHRYVHRAVMERKLGRKLRPGERVDHINRDPLDNRVANLRLATSSQNSHNTVHKHHSPYGRGVAYMPHRSRRKYVARICVRGQSILIGYFSDAVDAAYVYDQFSLALVGRFGVRNFL